MRNLPFRRPGCYAATLAITALLTACIDSNEPTHRPQVTSTDAAAASPTQDLYYDPVSTNFCQKLELETFLAGLGFGPDIDVSDGRYSSWPSPGSARTTTPRPPEWWRAYCIGTVVKDHGRPDIRSNVEVAVFTDHAAAELTYRRESGDHPREIARQDITGWWDEGTATEVEGGLGTPIVVSYYVRHENLALNVWVTVDERDRDRDEASAIGHETGEALVNEAIRQVPQAEGR